MLSKEQFDQLKEGDILDLTIARQDQHPWAGNLVDGLQGRTIRVVVASLQRSLISNELMRKAKGPDAMDPIARSMHVQALSGGKMPAHILRIQNDQGQRTTPMRIEDWSVMEIIRIGSTQLPSARPWISDFPGFGDDDEG